MKTYVSDTCEVICEDNGNKVTAEILAFNEKRNLTVSLNRSIKLLLTWNGRVYEGKAGPLSFVSDGPTVTVTKTSSRG
jgi:hypothetical protein